LLLNLIIITKDLSDDYSSGNTEVGKLLYFIINNPDKFL
jgi:hypothetical protein